MKGIKAMILPVGGGHGAQSAVKLRSHCAERIRHNDLGKMGPASDRICHYCRWQTDSNLERIIEREQPPNLRMSVLYLIFFFC